MIFNQNSGCLSWSETGLCSGHGKCLLTSSLSTSIAPVQIHEAGIPDSICVCNDGWTGYADWVNTNPYDCPHPTIAILIFYILQILVCVIAVVYIARKLYRIFVIIYLEEDRITVIEDDDVTADRGKRHAISHWLSIKAVRMCLLSLPVPIGFLIISALRLSDINGHTIGTSVVTTTIRAICVQFFWATVTWFAFSCIAVSLNITNIGRKKSFVSVDDHVSTQDLSTIRRLRIILITCYCGGLVSFIITLIWPFFSRLFEMNVLVFCLLHMNGLAVFTYFVAVIPLGKRAERILTEDTDCLSPAQKQERTRTSKNLAIMLKTITNGVLQNIVLAFVFGWWPWMRQNYMYMSCFQGMVMAATLCQILSLYHYNPSTSTSRHRTSSHSQKTRSKNHSMDDPSKSGKHLLKLHIPKSPKPLSHQLPESPNQSEINVSDNKINVPDYPSNSNLLNESTHSMVPLTPKIPEQIEIELSSHLHASKTTSGHSGSPSVSRHERGPLDSEIEEDGVLLTASIRNTTEILSESVIGLKGVAEVDEDAYVS